MSQGRSLELFFVDGRPDGMLTAEVFDWTGHVLRLPRTQLAEGLKRPEASQTGVYILIGHDDDGPLAYIGESENMAQRLKEHASARDWWDDAILITAARDGLHKAHVRYLEARLIQIARDAGQTRLENGNQPGGASLNEAHTANMESFLETLNMVLPAIRVDVFQTGRRTSPPDEPTHSTDAKVEFELTMPRHGVHATAQVAGAELVVLAGSILRADWIGDRSDKTYYWKLYDRLKSQGIIVQQDGQTILASDYAFASPSAAAAVVSGRAANGRTSWKLADGKTYAQWEHDRLNEASI